MAVKVDQLTRGYGKGKKRIEVLTKYLMRVESGEIYGRLEPSYQGGAFACNMVFQPSCWPSRPSL